MNAKSQIHNDLLELPSLPAVVVQLSCLLSDPDVSLSRLVDILKYDPALTARLLRMANSAYFGVSHSVVSIKDALMRLGTSRLYRMIIASTVQPLIDKPYAGYSFSSGELWRHCVAVGVAAEEIEAQVGARKRELAFTAGLLHDVGKMVMDSYVERDLSVIEEKSDEGKKPFDEAEFEVLEISHPEVGATLLEKWGFPDELVAVARWHHEPSKAPEERRYLTDIVHIADATCMMMGICTSRDALQYKLSAESLTRLGLKEKALDLVTSRTYDAMKHIIEMFENVGGD